MRAVLCALGVAVLVGSVPVPAAAADPAAGGGFVLVPAARLFDTGAGTVPAGSRTAVPVAGRAGVPAVGVAAVLLSLTAGAPAADGWLTAYPHGGVAPDLRQVSFAARTPVAQGTVAVPLGADGSVEVANRSAGRVRLAVDVVGYYRSGGTGVPGGYVPVPPALIGSTSIQAGAVATLPVAGVPAGGVSAVLVNLTASGTPGSLVAYRHGSVLPPDWATFDLAATPVSIQVPVQVGEDGSIDLRNDSAGTATVTAHVVGWYSAGPALADGTFADRPPTPVSEAAGPVPAGGVDPVRGVPGSVAVLAVTVTGAPEPGTIAVNPTGASAIPGMAFGVGTTSALLVARVGPAGSFDLRNDSTAAIHLRVTEVGLYTDGTLGAVAGRVSDEAGQPVENVELQSVATGPDGRYALSGLPAGDSGLMCFDAARARGSSAPNGNLDQCVGRLDVPAGGVVALDGHLREGGAVTGTIQSAPDGVPLGNVRVRLTRDGVPLETRTDASGDFAFRRLEEGDYLFCYDQAGPISPPLSPTGYAAPPGVCEDLIIPVSPPETVVSGGGMPSGAAIAGRVTDRGGNPVRGAELQVLPLGPPAVAPADQVVTAADGTYRITGIHPGVYSVCAGTEHATGAGSSTGYLRGCIAEGLGLDYLQDRTGVDLVLDRGGAIAGTVTGANGRPAAGVRLRLSLFDLDPVATTTTGPDGHYRFPGLSSSAAYSVCAEVGGAATLPPPTGLPDQCSGGTAPLHGPHLQVQVGQLTSGVDFRLGAGGVITGRITDTAGNPLRGVDVRVVGGEPGQDVRSRFDGTYTARWLYTGPTRLCFSAPGFRDQCLPDLPVTFGRTIRGRDVVLQAA